MQEARNVVQLAMGLTTSSPRAYVRQTRMVPSSEPTKKPHCRRMFLSISGVEQLRRFSSRYTLRYMDPWMILFGRCLRSA